MRILKILLILFTLKHTSIQSENWLDTKFDLTQIGDQSTNGNFKNEQDKIDFSNNKENDDVLKSGVRKQKINEFQPAQSTNQTNEQNKIDDFELNKSTDDSNKDQPNSTLSLKQPRLFSLILDKDHLITLFWTVNYEQKHILFELKFNLPNQVIAPFLAFGFSSYGEFENADLCILWNDAKNRFHFQDTWTDLNGFINLDKQNDCELLSTKKSGNQIYLLFKRKFNTCDKHDFKLEKGTNHLIYALGNGKLEQVYGLRLNTIKRKGFTKVSLFKSKQIPPLLNPDDVHTIEFKTSKIIIPSADTTYWCKIHKFPDSFKQKRHIVRYESVIQPGNEQLVHHMELYMCVVNANQEVPNYNGQCTGSQVPSILSKCRKVVAAWAMGAAVCTITIKNNYYLFMLFFCLKKTLIKRNVYFCYLVLIKF